MIARRLLFFIPILFLVACSQSQNYAPVTTAWYQSANAKVHRVRQGETLYAIAFRYGFDYRELAKSNRLLPPFHLNKGQLIKLQIQKPVTKKPSITSRIFKWKPKPTKKVVSKKITPKKKIKKLVTKKKVTKATSNRQIKRWYWPAIGKVVARYSIAKRNKGIDIAGRKGSPIRAAAAGKIAYAGDGLFGYGKLLIIKHNDEFLSAYAHNKKILVKEGDWVKARQKIAEMGSTGTEKVMLHFEIRKAGKPVNPERYLPRKK